MAMGSTTGGIGVKTGRGTCWAAGGENVETDPSRSPFCGLGTGVGVGTTIGGGTVTGIGIVTGVGIIVGGIAGVTTGAGFGALAGIADLPLPKTRSIMKSWKPRLPFLFTILKKTNKRITAPMTIPIIQANTFRIFISSPLNFVVETTGGAGVICSAGIFLLPP
jgi:hypothetical protein